MKCGAYISGIYPRSERLIEATRLSAKNLEEIFMTEKKKTISLQQRASLTYISEPKQNWDDMLRPFCIENIKIGGLSRFYENNTFYKAPVITDRLTDLNGAALKYLSPELLPKNKPWKIDIPEPYTFASLADNRFYKNKRELVLDLADLLAKEISSLVNAGFSFIQLNGHSIPLAKDKDALKDASDGIRKITKGLNAKVYLQTHFENVSEIFNELLGFKVDGLGIDFTKTKIDSLRGIGEVQGIACGLVDAQNTKMESPSEIAKMSRSIIEILKPKEFYLCPSSDLEFLPCVFANRKVRLLGDVLTILNGERK